MSHPQASHTLILSPMLYGHPLATATTCNTRAPQKASTPPPPPPPQDCLPVSAPRASRPPLVWLRRLRPGSDTRDASRPCCAPARAAASDPLLAEPVGELHIIAWGQHRLFCLIDLEAPAKQAMVCCAMAKTTSAYL